jgi:hypothetical protein
VEARLVTKVAAARGMPAGRGVAPLADIPNGECRDGGPELVIRGEDAVVAAPMHARRRDQIVSPVARRLH